MGHFFCALCGAFVALFEATFVVAACAAFVTLVTETLFATATAFAKSLFRTELLATTLLAVEFHFRALGFACVVLVERSHFGVDSFTEEIGIFQCLYHTLGIASLHIEQRVVAEQVDATEVHTLAVRVAVKQLNQTWGEETVGLTSVDKHTLVAFFCCAAVLVAGVVVLHLRTLLAFRLLLFRHIVEFGSIFVVFNQAVELQRKHTFEEVFAVEPRKFFQHRRHKFCDFVLLYLHLFQTVGKVEELLFDDGVWLRHLATLERFTDMLFNVAEFVALTAMDKRDAHARFASTAGTTASVIIHGVVVGQTVTDDVRKVVHVKTTRSHIGSHEQLQIALTELLHHGIALRLREVAVQSIGIVTVLNQFGGDFLSGGACAAEDNAIHTRQIVANALQCQVFIVGTHHVVDVAHVGRTLVSCADDILLWIVHIVFGDRRNFGWHGGREHQHLACVGHMFKNIVDVVHKTHVQHFIGFVKNHRVHILQVHLASLDKVEQTAWCSHNDLHAFTQGTDLHFDTAAAIHWQNAQVIDIFCVVVEVVASLHTQLASGVENNSLSHLSGGIYTLKRRQAECGSLARTCLCQTHYVGIFIKQMWNYFFLNGHWRFVAQFGDCSQKILADP